MFFGTIITIWQNLVIKFFTELLPQEKKKETENE